MPSSGQKFCKGHLNSFSCIVASVLPKRVKTQLNLEGKKGPQLCWSQTYNNCEGCPIAPVAPEL